MKVVLVLVGGKDFGDSILNLNTFGIEGSERDMAF